MRLLWLLPAFTGIASASVPYSEYILAPKSRTLQPVSVHSSNGTVTNAKALLASANSTVTTTFTDNSATAYDFGFNIAGYVILDVASVSNADQYIGVTFSESSLWVSNASSDGTSDLGRDATLWFHVSEKGVFTAPREKERGGFRYMTLVHNGTGSVELKSVKVHYTAMPHWEDNALGNYTGFFHCDDDLLNRIWYAGAYTNQLCTVDPKHGNALTSLGTGNPDSIDVKWYYNSTITNGSSALVDGAKRDRLVWPGDMAIALPGIIVATNDVITIENSLNSLFDLQDPKTGQLPYSGRPLGLTLSFTYHLYTLIGVADHYLYSGDVAFFSALWPKWKFALSLSLSFIDSSGLANVPYPSDWLRSGMGGHNIEANSILYYTINQGISLATVLNDTSPIANWTTAASRIKDAANALLWKPNMGMYIDNENSTLAPQDGNSWAIVANLTHNSSQIESISKALTARWTPYGAPAPEAGDAVSPFISGFELQSHFLAHNASAALALMRLQWGFMLNDPRMTNSTFIEGYSTSGSLHYAPYASDPRVSHAHGWATGPTSSLSFYVAGLQVLTAGGKTWRVAPALGDLKHVHGGFSTKVGRFEAETKIGNGMLDMNFETPQGTTGEVEVPQLGCKGEGMLQSVDGKGKNVNLEQDGAVAQVEGGKWKVVFECAK